ncbi:MAG: hypothetical protein B6D41_00300 [Chloroflexi bacterium UTCFX4]|jgi:serine/threonine-protein kinase|nr:MAG: hypothetical protein B6D41_00300 [Chloroflexi bacterium UTCFX4]
MNPCPSCGSLQNRPTSKFCANCGAALAQPANIACLQCNAQNPSGNKFCHNCGGALTPSGAFTNIAAVVPPNQILQARYMIVRQIGSGGMGAVYQVNDARLAGKQWAIKEMSDAHVTNPLDHQVALDGFRREAQLLATLDHFNLPKVTDYFQENNKYYLVMEFVSGDTLEQIVARTPGMLDEARVLNWARQLCEVLEYLHTQLQPIVFRDLKPANIMLTPQEQIKLIDFGIARFFQAGKKKDTALFGTAGYAAPEQYGIGQTDARSDIYSFGVVLHHLLTKHDPASTPFMLPAPRSLNPNLTAQTEGLILRAIQNKPADRFQTIAEVRLQMANSGLPIANRAAQILQSPVSSLQSPISNPQFPIHPASPVAIPPSTPPGMILIPAGEFLMGGNKYADERPPHRVYLDSFLIDRFPVTNLQYQQFIHATLHKTPKHWAGDKIPQGKENHPVVYVSWNDARAYCQWAGKRLPTEAEWEKAARGTDGREYPWGAKFAEGMCNARSKKGDTTAVGLYPPESNSPYDIADMAGNVWEWCADWFDNKYYAQSPARNPQGPAKAIYRASRGGAWNSDADSVRTPTRHGLPPETVNNTVGFRCAK